MKPCTTVLCLLAAGIATADQQPEWLQDFRTKGADLLQSMQQMRQKADKQIDGLGQGLILPVPEDADDSLPPARDGYAVAVADGGMVVDREGACVTYIGNVRLNEARLQLRCRNRVYLKIDTATLKKGEDHAANDIAPKKDAPRKKPTAPVQKAASTAPDTPAPEAKPLHEQKAQEPLVATAHDTVVDSHGNNIFLRSDGGKGVPRLKQAGYELDLEARTDGGDSYLLADGEGNAHLQSGGVTLHWVDAQGRPGTLVAEHGRLEFNRANNTLYVDGPADLTMPDGSTLTCKESLCAKLHPTPGTEPDTTGAFMAQFTSMRFDGVESAIAKGDVHAARPAEEDRPAAAVSGELCTYNGQTGECRLEGADCTLTYGPQSVHTKDGITLEANGDIIVHGTEVTGTYELPAEEEDGKPAQGVAGTYRTAGEVRFRAEDGTVTLPAGLQAQDPDNHFRCTGPLVLQLKRTGKDAPARKESGMLNLAVAEYGEVSTVDATGDVDMLYKNAARKQEFSVLGEHAFFDLEKGTARIESAPGGTAKLDYGVNRIIAQAEGDVTAHMSVDEEGDIDVQGDTVHADLPFQDGRAVVDCCSYLRLARELSLLRLGPQAKLVYPGGILTANGPTELTLSSDTAVKAPAKERYPHLSYNYNGVEKAVTLQGGTLRTEKASMECRGPILVTVDQNAVPDKKDKDGMGRIHATAEQEVAILMKDATGRIIRATGDRLVVDGASGTKVLTGRSVTLADKNNTHTATGKGACVTVDRNNNARIQGERHITTATRVQEQINKPNTGEP